MKVRVLASILILAIAFPVVIFSQYILYPITLSILSLFAVFELLRVIGLHKEYALSIPAYLIAVSLPVASYFVGEGQRIQYLLFVFALLFIYLLYSMGIAVFSRGRITMSRLGEAFLAVTYSVASFTSLSTIRYLDEGLYTLMLVFFISWGCDSVAYIVGTLIGKHKLIPSISPKKSVEGAVGGIAGAVILTLGFGAFVKFVMHVEVNFIYLAIYAIVLSVVSQVGDLVASLIKREHGVKDYSHLIPGHGGIMDRFDSVLAVATPLLIFCLVFPPFT